ncbi:MAG: iron ABC transporter permease, partial [Verrucomicrobiaceae bacterium]
MSSAAARLVFLITLAFFACFFVVPIWGSVKMAFTDAKGGFTFDYIFEVFANPLYRQGLINSFSMAV